MPVVTVKPSAVHRLLQGHRWVFANEVAGRIKDHEPGSWVEVVSSKGGALGSGTINPHSLIAVRLLAGPGEEPSAGFFRARLEAALKRRQRWYPNVEVYRLIYGDADGLGGLIVDRYGALVVYQITTLGMSRYEGLIQDLLREVLQPSTLVCRNDVGVRTLEGLPLDKSIVHGTLERPVEVRVGALRLLVDPLQGQKTGLFLDQRDNREAAGRWFEDQEVLDLFCYDGSWGLTAAARGARRVVGVDQSERALELASANARQNGWDGICRFERADGFTYLKQVPKKSFDVVVVDPPAFVKSRQSLPEGLKGYTDLNRRALLAVKSGGLLITCSCSYHLSDDLFRRVLVTSAKAAGRQLRLLEMRGQALDHPVLPAMPETRYLKCCILEVD